MSNYRNGDPEALPRIYESQVQAPLVGLQP